MKPRSTRRLVDTALASTIAVVAMLGPVRDAKAAHEAKSVIVFVGSGFGPVIVTAARVLRYKEEGTLTVDTLPYVARVKTASLDSQSGDHSASTSALLTGVRLRNGVVAMDADTRSAGYAPGRDAIRNVPAAENRCPASGNGKPSTTLLELAVAKGKSTGVVTTSRLTAGGSAAAFAHVCHRDAEYEIARQLVPKGAGFNERLGTGVTVLLGGISQYWRPFDAARRPRGRPDNRELVGELQTQGYTFVSDLTAMNAAPIDANARLIGLFDFAEGDGPLQGHMSFDLDRDPNREPSLAQMTAKALDVLTKNPAGFFLVVEGARIDHALRGSHARRALVDAIAFDDAVRVALERVDLSRTLLLVTSDHDAPVALIGGGRRGSDVLGLHLDPVTGKPATDGDGNTYTNLVFGTGANRPDKRATLDTPSVLQKDYQQEAAIRLAPVPQGGGGDVTLYATGVGASGFRGTIDQPRVFGLIRNAADF